MRLEAAADRTPPGIDIVEFVQRRRQAGHSGVGQRNCCRGTDPLRRSTTATCKPTANLSNHGQSTASSCISSTCSARSGERFPIRELKLADLQGYVDHRAQAKGISGKRLSPATIRKEIVCLRTAWNWGARMELVAGRFPNAGLRYPKTDEKPPFQTRDQIERQIKAGGLKPHQKKELWHALYLQTSELVRGARSHSGQFRPSLDLRDRVHSGSYRSEAIRADPDQGHRCGLRGEDDHHPGEEARSWPTHDSACSAYRLPGWRVARLFENASGRPGSVLPWSRVARSKKRSKTTGHRSNGSREQRCRAG